MGLPARASSSFGLSRPRLAKQRCSAPAITWNVVGQVSPRTPRRKSFEPMRAVALSAIRRKKGLPRPPRSARQCKLCCSSVISHQLHSHLIPARHSSPDNENHHRSNNRSDQARTFIGAVSAQGLPRKVATNAPHYLRDDSSTRPIIIVHVDDVDSQLKGNTPSPRLPGVPIIHLAPAPAWVRIHHSCISNNRGVARRVPRLTLCCGLRADSTHTACQNRKQNHVAKQDHVVTLYLLSYWPPRHEAGPESPFDFSRATLGGTVDGRFLRYGWGDPPRN